MLELQKAGETIRGVITIALDFAKQEGDTLFFDAHLPALQRVCEGVHADNDLDAFTDLPALFNQWKYLKTLAPDLPDVPSGALRTQMHYWLRCLIFRELLNFCTRHNCHAQAPTLNEWARATQQKLQQEYPQLPRVRAGTWSDQLDSAINTTVPIFLTILGTYVGYKNLYPSFDKNHYIFSHYLGSIGVPILGMATVSLCTVKYYLSPKTIIEVEPLALPQNTDDYFKNTAPVDSDTMPLKSSI